MKNLKPKLKLLRKEYVLVQAWKKTAKYIRSYNWFSDTLELDRAAVNLPEFIKDLQESLRLSNNLNNNHLRIIPAPKSHPWGIKNKLWEPEEGISSPTIRPLAYVRLHDQVIATAIMLCLADRVEKRQGDPRLDILVDQNNKKIISYGNRLFCDRNSHQHRWGSCKLYRAYYEDFRKFLNRSESFSKKFPPIQGRKHCIVHADLRQFYDRVSPALLAVALEKLSKKNDDEEFIKMAKSFLCWGWHEDDEDIIESYSKNSGIENFSQVVLPQGLVASGFFANLVLLSFDDELKKAIGTKINSKIRLLDVCRYVDDFRILVETPNNIDQSKIKESVSQWINNKLIQTTPGLSLSPEKTKIIVLGEENPPLIRQSERMNRIQTSISGGFDSQGGEDILDAIEGLIQSQVTSEKENKNGWQYTPIPDVREDTVVRFSASRYRSTYRSLRPLLHENDNRIENSNKGLLRRIRRTQRELDEEAKVFAYGLIKRWVDDPSNVRLLRIGLDLWPDEILLKSILKLLLPYSNGKKINKNDDPNNVPQWIAWYCLSEIFRAGATETGFVADDESLPSEICLKSFRTRLCKEAIRIIKLPKKSIPWYLRQQALLFLAAFNPNAKVKIKINEPETIYYNELISFLRGEENPLEHWGFAELSILARRSFMDKQKAILLIKPMLNNVRKIEIAKLAPSFILELQEEDSQKDFFGENIPQLKYDLCLISEKAESTRKTLAEFVLAESPSNPLRNELLLLKFSEKFLNKWNEKNSNPPLIITPAQVILEIENNYSTDLNQTKLEILKFAKAPGIEKESSIYEVPDWCEPLEAWRFQLGYLLRFILAQNPEFTQLVREPSWKETRTSYRAAESHWYQRIYGFYSGQTAFGDNWAPITEWMEMFLLALLRWPGCRIPDKFNWVGDCIEDILIKINERIQVIEKKYGYASNTLILPLEIKRPEENPNKRPIRVCVVQTVEPKYDKISKHPNKEELTLNNSIDRRKHRNHLSSALSAVKQMLDLRETHRSRDERLDWLILPELAVHPSDIYTHLIPFARAYRTIILTGLTYQEISKNKPLFNSALWVVPEWSDSYGLQIRTRQQGKANLAREELKYNIGCTNPLVEGFRPCQWLVGYPWDTTLNEKPLWLTAAVCYDATDLGLVSDLRNQSDIFAIPALNKDVKTFDQMAVALHYHMFQTVIVVNNGTYGGSNAYWPRKKQYERQIFHTHGQPQASISFLEIDDINYYHKRKQKILSEQKIKNKDLSDKPNWKFPPAGIEES